MRLNILLVFCCVIIDTSAVNSAERAGDANVSVETHNRVKRQDPLAIAGDILSCISAITSWIAFTVGLSLPSSTNFDTVIAQMVKVESHLATLDSPLMDAFDVIEVKDVRNRIASMKQKRRNYLLSPNNTYARNDYVSSCTTNNPQAIVSMLFNAQSGDKLFGAKKLSDYCILYRSKDLYLYGVSPYKTAQRLVLYAQEAFLNAVICMNAKGQASNATYFVPSFQSMLSNAWKLNQSLDADLRMEETRVKYAIKNQMCVGSRTVSDQDRHYTSYFDCQQNPFQNEQLWKFEFVELVIPTAPLQYQKPVYCNASDELKYTPPGMDRVFRFWDVHNVPRFASGYAQFDNNSFFQMRNGLTNEVVFAVSEETQKAIATPQSDFTSDLNCVQSCSITREKGGDPETPFSMFKIQRNPKDRNGATTFTIISLYGLHLTWIGGKCYCSYFDYAYKLVPETNLWFIVGVDSAGKATPLV